MPKPTQSPALAALRLASALGFIKANKQADLWLRETDGLYIGPRCGIKALAFFADLARRHKLDASVAAWNGKLPLNGLSGWEQAALQWLQL